MQHFKIFIHYIINIINQNYFKVELSEKFFTFAASLIWINIQAGIGLSISESIFRTNFKIS